MNIMKKTHTDNCSCPFCEKELKSECLSPDFCTPCDADLTVCQCGQKYSGKLAKCPKCGAEKKNRK
jgi:hypothetical protein